MKKINMRKFNLLKNFLALTFLCLFTISSYAQKIAIVGYNGATGDGYTIVALENIGGGQKFYFTDKEYNNTTGTFNAFEGLWSYTTPAGGLSTGDVVTFTETSTNFLALACNNPLSLHIGPRIV